MFRKANPAAVKPVSTTVRVQRDGAPLVCHGCAHSAADEPYPGRPSGERPCAFCIRNPNQAHNLAEIKKRLNPGVVYTARYDNGPTRKEVGDQYIATDRLLRDVPPSMMVIT